MIRYKIVLIIVSVLFLFACTPTNKIKTTNIQDITSYEVNSILYALPKTVIIMDVRVIRHLIVPGPYAAYAKKYLSIEGVPTLSNTKWEIDNIELRAVEEPDPDHYYSVTNDAYEVVRDNLIDFTHAGLMVSPGIYHCVEEEGYYEKDKPTEVYFTDLSVKRSFPKINDPETGKTIPVSESDKFPAHRKLLEAKTIEQKAEEAANFIIKTRKRRFKLLAGQYDVFPEGMALETSVRELNKTEAEYLSLFIGKVYTDTINEVFIIDPRSGEELQRETIFRFSEDNGIINSRTSAGKVVIIEIRDLGQTRLLEHMMIPGASPTKENMLYYRIPDLTEVRVLYGSHELTMKRIPVYQLGAIAPYYIPEKIQKRK